jgi:hypothetical protein
MVEICECGGAAYTTTQTASMMISWNYYFSPLWKENKMNIALFTSLAINLILTVLFAEHIHSSTALSPKLYLILVSGNTYNKLQI